MPLLFACEEAHRYAPGDKSIGFGPTRKAISRIAKEGRKYRVFLAVVTQRPAELDATIISQCSTIFCMRMANERDQNIIRSAVSDAAAGLLAFVPSLGTREVFAFGEGVELPTRLRFAELSAAYIPRSESASTGKLDSSYVDFDPDRTCRRAMARSVDGDQTENGRHIRAVHIGCAGTVSAGDRKSAVAGGSGDDPSRSIRARPSAEGCRPTREAASQVVRFDEGRVLAPRFRTGGRRSAPSAPVRSAPLRLLHREILASEPPTSSCRSGAVEN